jgi:hypothetical protein
MWDRLGVIGGAGIHLNMFAAMKIAGFADPEQLYKGMDAHEFEFNEKMLTNGDPRNDTSWIQIDTVSFIQWLERRSQLPLQQTRADIQEILFKLGIIQDELYRHGQIITQIDNRFFENRKRSVARKLRPIRYKS